MEIGEAKQKMEATLKDKEMAAFEEFSSDEDNVPIFTAELGALKDKMIANAAADEMMDDDEDAMPNTDQYPEELSDSESEKDDYTIRKTDSLIVAATADDDFSNLEVYIYDH